MVSRLAVLLAVPFFAAACAFHDGGKRTTNSDSPIEFRVGEFSYIIGGDGQNQRLAHLPSGRELLRRPSPVAQIVQAGQLRDSNIAYRSGDTLFVGFENCDRQIALRARIGIGYLAFDLVGGIDALEEIRLLNLNPIELGHFGGIANVVWDAEIVLGVFSGDPAIFARCTPVADPTAEYIEIKRGSDRDCYMQASVYRQPAAALPSVALLLTSRGEFNTAMPALEAALQLPVVFDSNGEWMKASRELQKPYVLARVTPTNVGSVVSWARDGGLRTILIEQGSWTHTYGNAEFRRDRYPNGLDDLRDVTDTIRAGGFKVGLHFLTAAVAPKSRLVTSKQASRNLAKLRSYELAVGVDTIGGVIHVGQAIQPKRREVDSYDLMIGGEILRCGGLSADSASFNQCERGFWSSEPAVHEPGVDVHELYNWRGRMYAYDPDSSVADYYAGFLASVANAIDADMIYLDGSEQHVEPSWYYRTRIQLAIYDKLQRRDVLIQGSSYTHFTWHFIARSASGEDPGSPDYTLNRIRNAKRLRDNLMPIEFGWLTVMRQGSTLRPSIEEARFFASQCSEAGALSYSVETWDYMIRRYPEQAQAIFNELQKCSATEDGL